MIRKFLPFAPGIPWKMKNGYILPKIDQEIWDIALARKEFVVLAYGGPLEVFASFAIAEALRKTEPSRAVFWAGNEAFKNLSPVRVADVPDLGAKYPVPLFLDKENGAYFNCLNNYLERKTYLNQYPKKNKRLAFEQIFNNSFLSWSVQYIPTISDTNKYEEWKKLVGFQDNRRFVLILPEKKYSQHHGYLNWNVNQVREAGALLRKFNLPVVVCTDNEGLYYDTSIIHAPMDIDIIIPLLKKSWLLLSDDIDYLIIGLMMSRAHIVSPPVRGIFDLYRHANLFMAENIISTTHELNPLEIYTLCKGLYD